MTISFFEPGDVPQPPDKVKIEHLSAKPSDDGWRVRVEVHVTPFLERPNLEMQLIYQPNDQTVQVADFSIIETMHPKMEFTMHIRHIENPVGDYVLNTVLYYRPTPKEGDESIAPPDVKDQKSLTFVFPPQDTSNDQ